MIGLSAFWRGFYGSVAKRSSQKEHKLSKNSLSDHLGVEGGGRSHHPPPPLNTLLASVQHSVHTTCDEQLYTLQWQLTGMIMMMMMSSKHPHNSCAAKGPFIATQLNQLNSTDLVRADWLYASTGSFALPIVGDSWVASARVSIIFIIKFVLDVELSRVLSL